jgi:benzylsuccinate CoA-transferase BbsE subunit
MPEGALHGIRVLDLSGEPGQFCGKLMGDLGADVLKIEPPAGDEVRRLGPFYEDLQEVNRCLYWHAMNTSKRAITLNLDTDRGRALLRRLLATADVVLESFSPGTLERWGLGFATLHAEYPQLILTSVTPFGQTGPYASFRGTDLEALALGGFLATCGDPDRPPVPISLPQSNLFASVSAFTGSLMAYFHRLRGVQGQQVDAYGIVTPRLGSTLLFGNYIPITFQCRDGYVQAIPILSWHSLLPWMEEEGMAGDLTTPEWQERLQTLATDWTQDQVDHACDVVATFLARFSKKDLYEEAVRRRILLYPVQNVRDGLEDRQLRARAYFVQVKSPDLPAPLTYPGAPFRMSATPWQIRRPAPALGAHNAEIYGHELGLSDAECAALQQEGVI